MFSIQKYARRFLQALIATATLAYLPFATAEIDADVTYVRPGVDFNQYEQFLISPLDLSDLNLVPPAWVENPEPRRWSLTDEDIAHLRSFYQDELKAGIKSRKQFKVVDAPAANTIDIDVKITRITPWAGRGEKTETLGSGEMAFEAQLRDAHSGDLLVIVEGVQNVGEAYQENKPFNHEHNFKEKFFVWGEALSDELHNVKSQ